METRKWSLIEKIYADESYKATYEEYLLEVRNGAFNADAMQATYDKYATLIEPYATTELSGFSFLNSSNDFQQAVTDLKSHAINRQNAVDSYLGN